MMEERHVDEFKILSERMKVHEARYYQLIIFTITVFGVILSLSSQISSPIERYFIPIILYSVLYITTSRGYYSKESMFLISTYIKNIEEKSHQKESFSSYKTFYTERNDEGWLKKLSKKKQFKKIFDVWYYLKEPFIIISFLALFISFYHIYITFDASQEVYLKVLSIAVIFYVLFVEFLIFKRVIELSGHNNSLAKETIEEFLS